MVTVPLLAFANKSIETAVAVDTAFLRFRKVFQGTEEDMVKMKQAAFDLSIKFGTSFEDVTEVLTEFNKAGIKSSDDLIKLGDITSKTAILFDTDMTAALSGVKSMMFGYGLTVDETAQALDAINIIADQTTASEKGVLEVMNHVAGTARQAGFSIREVAAAQGVFEASAIPAGRAGNALKSILTSLNKQSNIAKGQWEALGVKMTFTEWKTSSASDKLTILAKKLAEVRKQGDVKSLKAFEQQLSKVGMTLDEVGEIADSPIDKLNLLKVALVEAGKSGDQAKIDEISKALSTMGATGETVEQKISFLNDTMGNMEKAGMTLELNDINEAMASLVGKFQINNLNVLLQDLAKNFDDDASTASIFYDALSKSDQELVNAAWGTEQLNKVLDSNVVKLAQSKARYQEVTAEIGEKLLPIKIKLIEKMSELLDKFNNLSPAQKDFVIKLAMVVAISGPVLAFIGLLTSGLGFLLSAISGIGSVIGGLTGAITSTGAAAGTAGTAVGGLAAAIGPLVLGAAVVATAALIVGAIVEYKSLQKVLEGVKETLDKNIESHKKWQEKINSLDPGPFKDKMQKINDQHLNEINNLDETRKRYEGLPGVWNAVYDQGVEWADKWMTKLDEMMVSTNNLKKASEDTGAMIVYWQKRVNEMPDGPAKEKMKNAIKQMEDAKREADNAREAYEKWPTAMKFAAAGLEGPLNWMLGKLKEITSAAKRAYDAAKKAAGAGLGGGGGGSYNSGGIVYAAQGMLARGRDTVPAMLSPGEMVLTKDQQQKMFNFLSGKSQMQSAGGPIVNINVGTMVASRGEQREFARRIQELLTEDSNRY
jgi:phage-related minor tail protein